MLRVTRGICEDVRPGLAGRLILWSEKNICVFSRRLGIIRVIFKGFFFFFF